MKKKALLLTLSAAALVAASVFGTYAYLTDTEAVTNTFTVGQVGITLDEKDVDNSTPDKERDIANTYRLLPGHEYIKDPTVHVDEKSEDCYVFVKVENGISAIESKETDYKTIADQIDKNGWELLNDGGNVYWKKWEKGNGRDLVVFEKFKIDGDSVESSANGNTVTSGKKDLEDYKDKQIVVTAYAVQADGFDKASDAWGATYGKS